MNISSDRYIEITIAFTKDKKNKWNERKKVRKMPFNNILLQQTHSNIY
jgi:hypothetical protein